MAKNIAHPEETEELVPLDEPLVEAPVELVVGPVPLTSPTAKRALGVKEPIIFKWKIVGGSQGMILTLFKSVEREEADAQLERLTREGYYKDLKILEADTKVAQPATYKQAVKKYAPKPPPPPPKPMPAARTLAPKRASPPAKKPPASKVAPKATAKAPPKAPAKAAKKKGGASASKKSSKGR